MKYIFLIGLLVASLIPAQTVKAEARKPLQIAGYITSRQELPELEIQAVSVNDPLFNQQDNLGRIKVPQAWDYSTGSSIVIAVVDTGIDASHEDLRSRIWTNTGEIAGNDIDDDKNGFVDDVHGYNFVDRNEDTDDDHGHGTGISSIIAASTNNNRGVAGINWSAKIMPVKVLDETGGGDFQHVASGIRYAADNGAKIINLSFGASSGSTTLVSAVNYALSKNVLILGAVGNAHENAVYYPAAYPGVVAVGSINDRDRLSSFSNYGTGVDLVAPGEAIPVADINNDYSDGYGTSFATAEVSGVASLVWARYPGLSYGRVAEILIDTAVDLGATTTYGAGRIDAEQAVTSQPVMLTGSANVSGAPAPANGAASANIGLTVSSGGQARAGIKVKATVSGATNIINGTKILGANESFDVGTTDTAGRVSFNLASTRAETKTVRFTADTGGELDVATTVTFVAVPGVAYQASWVSQSPYPSLSVGDTSELTLTLKNTGTTAWLGQGANSSFGQLKLGTDRPQDRTTTFYDQAAWLSPNRSTTMDQSIVRPGETATFSFAIKASTAGKFREYFRPVVEGMAWLNDLGIYWDITVAGEGDVPTSLVTDAGGYSAQLMTTPTLAAIARNQSAFVTLDFKNIGSTAWQPVTTGTSLGEVKIGTALPQDRASIFKSATWLSGNRVVGSDFRVDPGSRISLKLPLTAPGTAGSYSESFRLVSEYVTWFGPIVTIPINVT